MPKLSICIIGQCHNDFSVIDFLRKYIPEILAQDIRVAIATEGRYKKDFESDGKYTENLYHEMIGFMQCNDWICQNELNLGNKEDLEKLRDYINNNIELQCQKAFLEWLSQGIEVFNEQFLLHYKLRAVVTAQYLTYQHVQQYNLPFFKLEGNPTLSHINDHLDQVIDSEEGIEEAIFFEAQRIDAMTKATEEIIQQFEKEGGILFIIDVGELHAHRLAAHINGLKIQKQYDIEVIPCFAYPNYKEMDEAMQWLYSKEGRMEIMKLINSSKKHDDKDILNFYQQVPITRLDFKSKENNYDFECEALDKILANLLVDRFETRHEAFKKIINETPTRLGANNEIVLSYLFNEDKIKKLMKKQEAWKTPLGMKMPKQI